MRSTTMLMVVPVLTRIHIHIMAMNITNAMTMKITNITIMIITVLIM